MTDAYKTPEGDEPIEVLKDGEWVEYPFDDLTVGDKMRAKRSPSRVCEVTAIGKEFEGVPAVIVKWWTENDE